MKRKPIYSASRHRTGQLDPASEVSSDAARDPGKQRSPIGAVLPSQAALPVPSAVRSRDGSAQRRESAASDTPVAAAALASRRFRLLDRPLATTLLAGVIGAALMLAGQKLWEPSIPSTRVADLVKAVEQHLIEKPLPSQSQLAYQKIAESVVLVRGHGASKSDKHGGEGKDEDAPGIGTGVVVVDKGVILTNLHVVAGADHVSVTFADGTESPARIINTRRESDLAVLQASIVPENLPAATLRSSHDLVPGAGVIAVGFPFGIGPSVSAGVVSGLKREFRSQEDSAVLTNLIQFDAAANPGNSGGPLVTMDGQVVGIVTAILNPTEHRVFAGIGFAVPIEDAASAVGPSPF